MEDIWCTVEHMVYDAWYMIYDIKFAADPAPGCRVLRAGSQRRILYHIPYTIHHIPYAIYHVPYIFHIFVIYSYTYFLYTHTRIYIC